MHDIYAHQGIVVDIADDGMAIVIRPAPSKSHAPRDDVLISIGVSATTGRFAVVSKASIFEHNKGDIFI
jgi:hypothetical protein